MALARTSEFYFLFFQDKDNASVKEAQRAPAFLAQSAGILKVAGSFLACLKQKGGLINRSLKSDDPWEITKMMMFPTKWEKLRWSFGGQEY